MPLVLDPAVTKTAADSSAKKATPRAYSVRSWPSSSRRNRSRWRITLTLTDPGTAGKIPIGYSSLVSITGLACRAGPPVCSRRPRRFLWELSNGKSRTGGPARIGGSAPQDQFARCSAKPFRLLSVATRNSRVDSSDGSGRRDESRRGTHECVRHMSGGDQFSEGFSTRSTTTTSTCAFVDSSFSPSCCWNAVKRSGAVSLSLGGGGLTPRPPNWNSSGVHNN